MHSLNTDKISCHLCELSVRVNDLAMPCMLGKKKVFLRMTVSISWLDGWSTALIQTEITNHFWTDRMKLTDGSLTFPHISLSYTSALISKYWPDILIVAVTIGTIVVSIDYVNEMRLWYVTVLKDDWQIWNLSLQVAGQSVWGSGLS